MKGEIIKEIGIRRARRAYDERPVKKEVLERVLNAAILAPSCANKQSWRFIVFNEPKGLDRARETLTSGNYWALKAPVLVMVLTRDDLDCMLDDDRNYAQFDTGMAAMNLMLQSTAEGLVAHPMAGYSPSEFRKEFSIEEGTRLLAMIAIGYPGDASHLNERHSAAEVSAQERKPLDEVVSWNEWSDSA